MTDNYSHALDFDGYLLAYVSADGLCTLERLSYQYEHDLGYSDVQVFLQNDMSV